MSQHDGQADATLVYDGDCGICRQWVDYWQRLANERVLYRPYQEAARDSPSISLDDFKRAIQLIEPDGQVYSGTAATYRVLHYAPGRRFWWWMYRRVPGFDLVSEGAYTFFARRRDLLSHITRILWGLPLEPERTTVGPLFAAIEPSQFEESSAAPSRERDVCSSLAELPSLYPQRIPSDAALWQAACRNWEGSMDEIIAAFETRRFKDALSIIDERFASELKRSAQWFSDGQRVEIALDEFASLYSGGVPKIVGELSAQDEERLLAAASLSLAGCPRASRKLLPRRQSVGSRLRTEVAVRMCMLAARHRSRIKQMTHAGIRRVRIKSVGNGCLECAQLDGTSFLISHVPELPYAACTCGVGCRCRATADLEESWWGRLTPTS